MKTPVVNIMQRGKWPLRTKYSLVANRLTNEVSIRHGIDTMPKNSKLVFDLAERLGLFLISEKRNFIACADPTRDARDRNLSSFLINKARELRDYSKCLIEDVSAVIVGGNNKSWELLNSIVEPLEDIGVPVSIIAGQDDSDNGLNGRLGENRLTVWGDALNQVDLRNIPPEEVAKTIENSKALQCVEFADNVKVNVVEGFHFAKESSK